MASGNLDCDPKVLNWNMLKVVSSGLRREFSKRKMPRGLRDLTIDKVALRLLSKWKPSLSRLFSIDKTNCPTLSLWMLQCSTEGNPEDKLSAQSEPEKGGT